MAVAVTCLAPPNVRVDSQSDFWGIDRDANIRFGLAVISADALQESPSRSHIRPRISEI